MYVSPRQTKALTQAMVVLAAPSSSQAMRQNLVNVVADLMNADYVASLVWDEKIGRFSQGVCSLADKQHIASYEAKFQFEDPIAPQLRALKLPTRVSQVIPQKRLVKSEFFDRFLHAGSMYWGMNVFAHDGIRDVGDLRIWRAKGRDDFNDNELGILNLLYPSIVQALSRTLSAKSESRDGGQSIVALRGRYAMTEREAQVAYLVSLGLADKVVANRIGVSFTTVRTYLAGALAKIGCANRKELIMTLAQSNHRESVNEFKSIPHARALRAGGESSRTRHNDLWQ
jgi:DNA-binding CsgD family transcriptional regulator